MKTQCKSKKTTNDDLILESIDALLQDTASKNIYAQTIEEFRDRAELTHSNIAIILKLSPTLFANLVKGDLEFINPGALETLDYIRDILDDCYAKIGYDKRYPVTKPQYVLIYRFLRFKVRQFAWISVYEFLLADGHNDYIAKNIRDVMRNVTASDLEP